MGSKILNNEGKSKTNIGVYSVPCKDCNSMYFGETGRSLEVRIEEHKRAMLGSENNMIAKHTWEKDHSINWKDSKIIYQNSNVGKRRIIEGPLIGICNTFKNNKAFTQEDEITNLLILKSNEIDINNFASHLLPGLSLSLSLSLSCTGTGWHCFVLQCRH